MNRRKLTKEERQMIYQKCNGHCAYCGKEIEYNEMQVDHITSLRCNGEDTLDNMLPACRSCNHYKATLDLEGFRKYLAGIHNRLLRDSVAYQVAERFGIVEHKKDEVVFYFENPDAGSVKKKGYWTQGGKSHQYFCSVCGGKESAPRPWCPRCGTKMTDVKRKEI